MAKSSVNVKIDSEVKVQASDLLMSMGLDMTTAIEMFFRQIIAKRKIPFVVEAPEPTLDEQLLTAIRRKKIPSHRLEKDEHGNIILENLPEHIRDWVVE